MANPQGPSGGTRPGMEASPTSGRDRQPATEEVTQAAAQEARDVGRQVRDAAEDAKHEAREAIEVAKEQARSTAASQKNAAAQQVDGFAHALQSASDDLRSRGQNAAAEYVRQAADGLERASGSMRERDVDDLIGTVEDFARRQPMAFLGGAVVAGFGLARLMKSSADRRRSVATDAGRGQGDRP